MPTVGAGFSMSRRQPRALHIEPSAMSSPAQHRRRTTGRSIAASDSMRQPREVEALISPQTILSCCGSFWEEQPVLSSAPPYARATVTRQRQPECADHE